MSMENKPQPKESVAMEENELWNKHVLIADDDSELAGHTKGMLELMGYTAEIVADGRELLERLEAAKPGEFGLIITDKEMAAGMDGVTAAIQIRQIENYKEIPLVLYSGTLKQDDVNIITKLGGICLKKPFSYEQLQDTVEAARS